MNSLLFMLPMLMGKKFDMSSLGSVFQQMGGPSAQNTGAEGTQDMSRLLSNPLLMSMLSGNKNKEKDPVEIKAHGFSPIEEIAGFQTICILFTLMKYGKAESPRR